MDAIYEAFLALHTGNDPDAVVSDVLAKVEEDGAEDRWFTILKGGGQFHHVNFYTAQIFGELGGSRYWKTPFIWYQI